MRLFTIGFTQKPAERFFDLLRQHEVGRLIDIRLNPHGQLSGFAKGGDLAFFLHRLAGCDYRHLPVLAPTAAILKAYRTDGNWTTYVHRFEALMDERAIPVALDVGLFNDRPPCLLCSEHEPARCHRRLVAERLARAWPDVDIVHLV